MYSNAEANSNQHCISEASIADGFLAKTEVPLFHTVLARDPEYVYKVANVPHSSLPLSLRLSALGHRTSVFSLRPPTSGSSFSAPPRLCARDLICANLRNLRIIPFSQKSPSRSSRSAPCPPPSCWSPREGRAPCRKGSRISR
jgi:hypothetical protein